MSEETEQLKKSLRNEIAKELWDFEKDGKVYTVAADDIINKVIDALSDSLRRSPKGISTRHCAIDNINKMRPKQ